MMLKKTVFLLLPLVLAFLTTGANGQETMSREASLQKASAALKSRNYKNAISVCLEQLSAAPNDYEFNFLLARAYSYSNDRENAVRVLDRLLVEHPDNTDVLIFKARNKFWMKDNRSSQADYRRVLKLRPGDIEALMGLADIEAAEKGRSQTLSLYRQIIHLHPEAGAGYFGCGRAYEAQGDFQKALEYYQKAVDLEPANADYRDAWNAAQTRLPKRYEIHYQYKFETFNDGRDDYLSDQLVFHFKAPQNLGSLTFKFNRTNRFKKRDYQFGLEIYPKLWRKAYAYIDLGYSPQALHYSRSSYLIELFQGLLSSAEISLGYWQMNFPAEKVAIYVGSVGYYLGNYQASLRCHYNPGQETRSFAWTGQVRRYFSDQNYIYLGYGRGSRAFEIITVQDLLIRRSWVFLSGVVWYLWNKVRLELHFSRTEEASGPKRDTFFAATGLQW